MAVPQTKDSTADTPVKTIKTVVAAVKLQGHIMDELAAYANEPTFANKAARDLTSQEAFDLLLHLVYKGEIELEEPIKKDKAGLVTYPKPAQQLSLGTRMAGVEFYRASNTGFKGNYKQRTFTPTAAFAIVLHRLAKFLGGEAWNASRIVWGGIGSGGDGKAKNCHEIGTCVDFYGAITAKGTFDVLADWGKQPITLKDGKVRPRGKIEIANDDLWGTETNTFYRLKFGDTAYAFFLAVYNFATEQCTVGSLDISSLSFMTGQSIKAGTIIHPDYSVPWLRHSHQEHMHFQLGKAFV